MTSYVLMVLPNEHVKANKKLKLQASSMQELSAKVAAAVKLGEDAVLCAPTTTGAPSASDQFTSLAELGNKAKVMIWPVRSLLGLNGSGGSGARSIALECPEDCETGDTVAIEVDGVEIEVEIPDGVGPGDAFEVYLPPDKGEEGENNDNEVDSAGVMEGLEPESAAMAGTGADPATAPNATGYEQDRSKLAQYRAEADALQGRLPSATATDVKKDSEIASLRQAMSDQAMAAKLRDKTVSELSAANSALEDKVALLQEELSIKAEEAEVELAMMQQEKAEIVSSQAKVVASLDNATAEAEGLASQLVQAHKKCTEFVSENGSLRATCRAEIEELREKLTSSAAEVHAQLRTEMDELRASHSKELDAMNLKLSAATQERELENKLAQQHGQAQGTTPASECELQHASETNDEIIRELQVECDRLRQEVQQGEQQIERLLVEKRHGARTGETASILGTHATPVSVDTGSQHRTGDDLWDHASENMGPALSDARQLGLTPALRRQLKSVPAIQKLANGNDAILSIAAELALWPAVRNAGTSWQDMLEPTRREHGIESKVSGSGLPEGVPQRR